MGVAVALTSVLWVPAAALLAWLAAVPALGIAWVARTCAEVPWGSIGWGESGWHAVALAALTVLALGLAPWAWRRSSERPLLALAVALVAAALAVPPSSIGWPPPGWLAVACDVGQGDGLVVNTGGGHAVVVDTGPEPALMDACLRRLDIAVVDLIVLTHFHADHTDGLEGVLAGRQVREIRVSPVREPEAEADEVTRTAARSGVPVGELRSGDILTVGAVRAVVWWPARALHAGSVSNNGSVVMTVWTGGVGILFTGDMEREAAAEVVRAARRAPEQWGHVDVIKVPHHGSANRDDRVLDRVAGRIALISVGDDNDYGHPAPSTLKSLQDRGFRVHRTDLDGDVALVGSSGSLRVVVRG